MENCAEQLGGEREMCRGQRGCRGAGAGAGGRGRCSIAGPWLREVAGWHCMALLTLSLCTVSSPRPSPEQDVGHGADGQPPAMPLGALH